MADRAKHLGWDQVPASEVYQAFNEIVASSEQAFASLADGKLARQVAGDIVHLITFTAGGRGGVYAFRWGVSLAYVPHEWVPKAKYHRTLKSARVALWEDVEFVVADPASPEVETCLVDIMHGAACMRSDLVRAWGKLQPAIRAFFSQSSSLEGVLESATAQTHRKWEGFRHSPDPGVVRAFTLARLGRLAEAESVLGEFIASQKSLESPEELMSVLKTISRAEA